MFGVGLFSSFSFLPFLFFLLFFKPLLFPLLLEPIEEEKEQERGVGGRGHREGTDAGQPFMLKSREKAVQRLTGFQSSGVVCLLIIQSQKPMGKLERVSQEQGEKGMLGLSEATWKLDNH